MVNPEVITFCLSWGLMEQKLKLFRLETIPEVAVRVKYNSFAACLLRLLLTSSGPAAGQQLRRRRRCPRPRAPRKGSRGSGRRFRAALPGGTSGTDGAAPTAPPLPAGSAGAGRASGHGRGLTGGQRGTSAGPGVPSVLVWVQSPLPPPPAAGRSRTSAVTVGRSPWGVSPPCTCPPFLSTPRGPLRAGSSPALQPWRGFALETGVL